MSCAQLISDRYRTACVVEWAGPALARSKCCLADWLNDLWESEGTKQTGKELASWNKPLLKRGWWQIGCQMNRLRLYMFMPVSWYEYADEYRIGFNHRQSVHACMEIVLVTNTYIIVYYTWQRRTWNILLLLLLTKHQG